MGITQLLKCYPFLVVCQLLIQTNDQKFEMALAIHIISDLEWDVFVKLVALYHYKKS